jgi:hypothetical protein
MVPSIIAVNFLDIANKKHEEHGWQCEVGVAEWKELRAVKIFETPTKSPDAPISPAL